MTDLLCLYFDHEGEESVLEGVFFDVEEVCDSDGDDDSIGFCGDGVWMALFMG